MKKFLVLVMAVGVGVILDRMFDWVTNTAQAGGGGETCVAENGDVNADGAIGTAS